MATESSVVHTPEDLRKNFDHIQTDLKVVRNELAQALEVWRSILASEKEEFKKTLDEQEKAWGRDEIQWQNDRQAYAQRIQELETFFNAQLSQTDKNAVRALNELDAAWQQERIRWQNALSQQSKDSRQTEELQSITYQQNEQRLAHLESENQQLKTQLEETLHVQGDMERQYQAHITALETQSSEWQSEKTAWQDSLSDRINELQQKENAWAAERQERESLIQSLQQELVNLEWKLRDAAPAFAPAPRPPQQSMDVYMNALESQVSSLQQFVQQMLPTTNNFRRRSDRTPPPRAAY